MAVEGTPVASMDHGFISMVSVLSQSPMGGGGVLQRGLDGLKIRKVLKSYLKISQCLGSLGGLTSLCEFFSG